MKTDDTKQLLLSDAVFRLLDGDSNLIASELVTDQGCRLKVKNLAVGIFQFIETKAPDGYERDEPRSLL
nr:SpaA isopeptide-forming pilin-related protein [Paenibacillus sp. 1001270B_150601_E10]